jgi:hypothetical protein
MRIEVLVGVVLGLLAACVPIAVIGPGYLRSRNEARLRAEGLPAMARIVSLEDTGNRSNYATEMIVHVEVTREGQAPWQASFRRVFSMQDINFFTPGRTFAVRYDPRAPEIVAYAP